MALKFKKEIIQITALIIIAGAISWFSDNFIYDKPLAQAQGQLIDLAFKTATAIPVQPHIKDRSKAQQEVVRVAIELDQPGLAVRYIEQIEGWRRGAAYGDLAQYFAKKGDANKVEKYLKLAQQIAAKIEDWHRGVIEERIDRVRVYLKQGEKSDSSFSIMAQSKELWDKQFHEKIKELDDIVKIGEFDGVLGAEWSFVYLYELDFDHIERRQILEDKVKSSWEKLPLIIRIELLSKMAEVALDHKDSAKSLQLVNDAQLILDGAEWPAEYQVTLMAKLAKSRVRAGDTQKAARDMDAALVLFNSNREFIIDIYRADTLTPVAEAYHAAGKDDTALEVYKKAMQESIVNPNSRPRAQNLASTCLSMALNGITPDDELWGQIHTTHQGLKDPW